MLMLGLLFSQLMPSALGANYESARHGIEILLGICLAFIMINVGREFEVDKSNLKSYGKDYLVAMLAAAMPWLLIAMYYIFVLMPSEMWGNGMVWRESLLLSRFAAPTSAGILFTMLAAIGLQKSWIYKKIQVLAIFDDLDTILLMIPLQIAMIGMQWKMAAILFVVVLLIWIGWKKMSSYDLRCDWMILALERYTESLGHSGVPEIFALTLLCLLRRCALLSVLLTMTVHSFHYLPALPALRRIYSPWYLTPLPR